MQLLPISLLADPLSGVVVWGSTGLLVWSLIAALVGSVLAILREWDRGALRAPRAPTPTHRTRRRAACAPPSNRRLGPRLAT